MKTDFGGHAGVLWAALKVLLGHGCEEREEGAGGGGESLSCEADGLPVGGDSGGDDQGVKQLGRQVARTG